MGRDGRRRLAGSAGRGRGSSESPRSERVGGPSDWKRRAFTKLLKDETAEMRDVHQAKRFLEGMATFPSKAELLAKLQDERDHGIRRLRDLLSFINSTADVETLFIPLLGHVLNDETNRPMYRPLRDKLLLELFHMPMLMEVLHERDVVADLSSSSAEQFCSFLRALTKPYIEPRQSEYVKLLSLALRDRGDVDEARILCSSLLVDSDPTAADEAVWQGNHEPKQKAVACWITDMDPPGGRHDNDHRNYRDIRIIPTVEELICEQKPYLPLADGGNTFIEDPVANLLDRNFRLLRDDAVSSMKTNLAEAETTCWKHARIVDLFVSTKHPKSVSFVVQCDRRSGRDMNWKRSRALMHGSIVALCRNGRPIRMGMVSVRDESIVGEWLNDPCGPRIGVCFESHEEFADSIKEIVKNCTLNATYCSLKKEIDGLPRTDPNRREVERRLNVYVGQLETYDLVEVSKSFFAYQPILKTLQDMDSIPLSAELVGSKQASVRPDYLPNEIFLPEAFGGYKVDTDNWSLVDIVRHTSLDISQANALQHSLMSRVVLTQGPPGTGKTFLGALVARTIRENTDESILCVCYTNHALDQFLEHMLEAGETRIVRMGGRSKSERLSKYQLKELARTKFEPDNFCQKRIKQVHAHIFKARDEIEAIIKILKTDLDWHEPSGGIAGFLAREDPQTLCFLTVPSFDESDGFTFVGPKGKKLKKTFLWQSWKQGEPFPAWLLPHMYDINWENETAPFHAFWSMSLDERTETHERWRHSILESVSWQLDDLIADFNVHVKEDQSLCRQSELEVLNSARIIGATTAGAAAYHDLLSFKAPGVVLVEEAGEVLESHVLAALAAGGPNVESTKHLILIGDHKQLPPKVENYKLTTTSRNGYNLDCSLFERLILAGQQAATLNVQHRMRPAISALIRSQTYPTLRDHESVTRYPEMKGISDDLLFIDHETPEDGHDVDNSTTRSNQFEADLCIEVVRYLLLQGYGTEQLVVLTPYLGQLLNIMTKIRALRDIEALVSDRDIDELDDAESETHRSSYAGGGEKKGVRCSSIDNYQGEEADIVIISLVRCNKWGNIGFLKERQRVNVLLSRARYCMILVGSSATLISSKKGGEVWEPILEQLSAAGRLVQGLPTTCQLHPNDESILLCNPYEFRQYRPNGGCTRPCTYRMSCGHSCHLMCHPTDRKHEVAQSNCCEPCRRFPAECLRSHPCPKLCKDDCGPCRGIVTSIPLLCGHIADRAYCHDVRSKDAILAFSLICQQVVTHRFRCGHEAATTCCNQRSPEPKCPVACGSPATTCGHPCQNICGSCDGIEKHSCAQTCSRTLFCGHECSRPCHTPSKCAPCKEPCPLRCSHSVCPQKCSFPCASCVEPCDWQCDHQGKCPLVCGAPCARLPCNERCSEMLECGHQCPSVCGEDCPDVSFCQQCGTENHLNQVVDMINLVAYRDQDLNEDPVVILPCKHFYTLSSMDGVLEIDKVYQRDESGAFVDLAPGGGDVSEKSKQCPDCRSIIHSVRRYGRSLRLIELRSLERKHMAMMDQALQVNEKRIRSFSAPSAPSGKADIQRRQMLGHLDKVEKEIRRSPMNRVFEACGGSHLVNAVAPPTMQLLRCLELRARAYELWTHEYGDINFQGASLAFKEAIVIADESSSILTGAKLRLASARLLLKYSNNVDGVRKQVNALLDWILEDSQLNSDNEVIRDAQELKTKLNDRNNLETIRSVMSAMSVLAPGGYNYGGSASDHWYECPNGHPYFIGECGQAMQESRCLECGLPVGGGGHALRRDNRQIGGLFRDALSR